MRSRSRPWFRDPIAPPRYDDRGLVVDGAALLTRNAELNDRRPRRLVPEGVRVEHFVDLLHTVVLRHYDGDLFVDWYAHTLYPCADGSMMWQRAGATSSPDMVDSLDDAERVIEGSTKWDGCTNWSFPDMAGPDGCAQHACSREGLLELGQLLARIHDLAGHMMRDAGVDLDFDPRPLPGRRIYARLDTDLREIGGHVMHSEVDPDQLVRVYGDVRLTATLAVPAAEGARGRRAAGDLQRAILEWARGALVLPDNGDGK